jgi:hypothetical protein
MKKMILLFSHTLTDEQKQDAKTNWSIEEFITLPIALQTIWSNVPSELEDIVEYLKPIREFLLEKIEANDIVLVQGDFGATYKTVSFINSLNGLAVYATTKRDVIEKEIDGKIIKTSVFKHIRFRRY